MKQNSKETQHIEISTEVWWSVSGRLKVPISRLLTLLAVVPSKSTICIISRMLNHFQERGNIQTTACVETKSDSILQNRL